MAEAATGLLLGAGFSAALALSCGQAPTMVERAALLSSRGRNAEAITLLEQHLSRDPAATAERRMLIRLYGTVGQLGRASAQAEELARRLPSNSPIPQVELGHVLELAHQYDAALAAYDRAAELAPADPLGPATGGLRAAHWGEAELAKPRLEEALRRDPSRADLWHALGLVRLHTGDLRGAASAYRSGLAADADALENRIGLATLALKRHEPAEALRQYERVIQRRPRFADAHLGRAWALILLGRLADAGLSLEQAERLGGDRRVIRAQKELVAELEMKRESQQNR